MVLPVPLLEVVVRGTATMLDYLSKVGRRGADRDESVRSNMQVRGVPR